MIKLPGAPAEIDPDIRKAETLPSAFYTDPAVYQRILERVFARSWQFVGDRDVARLPGSVYPFSFLRDSLDEPLLVTRDYDDTLRVMSNVCTHRGFLVAEHAGCQRNLRCRYHGRRFALDGRFQSMPEFEDVEGFPSAADDLTKVPHALWGRWLFAALEPEHGFEELMADVESRMGWLPADEFVFDAARSRDYLVRANWALYCDNYLEGFHIPFVHTGLDQALDYGAYRTELFERSSLQIGEASGNTEVFDLPVGHVDHGQRIAAYYYFLFPNTMLNFYPWGLSINVVRPVAVDRTKVSFLSWVWDESRLDASAGAALDRVEREDEAVVESVQIGMRSRLYNRGRYSPRSERGVHHFHGLLSRALAGGS